VKFSYEGTDYIIDFVRQFRERPAHVQPRSALGRIFNTRRSVLTTGKILKVIDAKTKKYEVVREGTAGHYWKDKFSFEAGRKAALAKAMYDAPTKGGGEPLIGTRLSKEFRTAVWEAYHGRVRAGEQA